MYVAIVAVSIDKWEKGTSNDDGNMNFWASSSAHVCSFKRAHQRSEAVLDDKRCVSRKLGNVLIKVWFIFIVYSRVCPATQGHVVTHELTRSRLDLGIKPECLGHGILVFQMACRVAAGRFRSWTVPLSFTLVSIWFDRYPAPCFLGLWCIITSSWHL
jgi:hypothetical protein